VTPDPRPLSAEEEGRYRARHIPYENDERSIVCSHCRSPWPCLPSKFLATLDAERARIVALAEVVQVDVTTLRETLCANLFDGDESGMVTTRKTTLLTDIVEVIEQVYGDIYREEPA
jgi:hypothetical protein